ncbi:unnamed protein product [Ophioblennius macclurei]
MEAPGESEVGFSYESGAAKVKERLDKRHQARIEDLERKKEANDGRTESADANKYFSSTFQSEHASIEQLLSGCSGLDRTAVTQKLEEATNRTAQLQRFLNDHVMFLTPYDLRKAQEALRELQVAVTASRDEFLPKKKFGFKARTKVQTRTEDTDPVGTGSTEEVDHQTSSSSTVIPEQCGFSNLRDDVITKTAEEIHMQDVMLTHLTNCRVVLPGSPSTLHLKHIDGCQILCGPVRSSVLVDQCRNSTLAFPCQQLRTHNTTDTRVYLHVTSRAIIEDCQRVGFAPFTWSYPTLDQDFAASGLDRDRNNWSQVDDFNWLAAGEPSPNWSVIPEEDRIKDWDAIGSAKASD